MSLFVGDQALIPDDDPLVDVVGVLDVRATGLQFSSAIACGLGAEAPTARSPRPIPGRLGEIQTTSRSVAPPREDEHGSLDRQDSRTTQGDEGG